jgi:hypothetical protein
MNEHTVDTVKCAICGSLKGETNHWRVLRVKPKRGAEDATLTATLIIDPWDGKLARRKGSTPTCGSACTQKAVERFLAGSPLATPAAGGAA